MPVADVPTRADPWGLARTPAVPPPGNAPLAYAELVLTGRCAGGCLTCLTPSAAAGEPARKTEADLELESAAFRHILRRLQAFGVRLVTFYGREPLEWDREASSRFLAGLIAYAHDELGLRVCLATSGLWPLDAVLPPLFAGGGILFMKNWGSPASVAALMAAPRAAERTQAAWDQALRLRAGHARARLIAEFLYTRLNRADLLPFWEWAWRHDVRPFIETPVLAGHARARADTLVASDADYVADLYALSLLNLQLRYGLSPDAARTSDLWQPPFGSLFPSPCDKLTAGRGVFVERDGTLYVCCGVPVRLGHVDDADLPRALTGHPVLQRIRDAYTHLGGACGACAYSRSLSVCYGCRGHAMTWGSAPEPLGEDPGCFLLAAARLGPERLSRFLSAPHLRRLQEAWPCR